MVSGYMNSMLQTLYHLPVFRELLYSLPTDADSGGSVPLSLQRVFYHLQTTATAVSTKHLTQAFGWNSLESWQQHDVQEFSRVLLDAISERVKKTDMEGKPDALFAGKSQMYVECVHVPYKSERVETYLDLAMNVKGCRGLRESFDQYVEVEMLDKDNAYRAEQFGLQEARKGSRFLTFPPVLQLQLKRFEYNFERDMNVKVNDRFEFPTLLDLSQYIYEAPTAAAPPAPSSTDPSSSSPSPVPFPASPPPPPSSSVDDPALYYLHSVLVHSGSGHGGHYYSFIRPFFQGVPYAESGWYKFDDETVTTATEEEATVGNYGGDVRGGAYFPLGRMSMSNANAYMLVYVRKSVVDAQLHMGAAHAALDVDQSLLSNGEHKEGEEGGVGEVKASAAMEAEVKEAAMAEENGVEEKKKMDVDAELAPAQADSTEAAQEDAKMVEEGKESGPGGAGEVAGETEETPLPVPIPVPLPPALLQRFQREEKEQAELLERKRRAHLFMELKVLSEERLIELSERTGMGIELRVGKEVGEDYQYDVPLVPVRVQKAHTLKEALQRRAEWTAEEDWKAAGMVELDVAQYWRLTARSNETERPNNCYFLSSLDHLSDMKAKAVYIRSCEWDDAWPQWSGGRAFTEQNVSNEKSEGDRCLLLLKWFDVEQQRMTWKGSLMVLKKLRMKEVKEYAYRMMKRRGLWTPKGQRAPPQHMEVEVKEAERTAITGHQELEEGKQAQQQEGTEDDEVPPMVVWEEENVVNDRITPLPDTKVVSDAYLRNGDLLCLQHAYTAEELDELRGHHTLSQSQQHALHVPAGASPAAVPAAAMAFFADAPSYLHYLYNRIMVEFRLIPYTPPTKEKPSPTNSTFRVELSKANTLREVLNRLSAHVGVEQGRLQLCKPSPLSRFQPDYITFDKGMGLEVVNGTERTTLDDVIDSSEPVLYYEVLEFNPQLLHDHFAFNCLYITRQLREEPVRVLVRKTATFADLELVVKDKLAALRRERAEKERKEGEAADEGSAAADEMKQDGPAAVEGVSSSSHDDERKEGEGDGPNGLACNFFCLSILDKQLKEFRSHELVSRFQESVRVVKSLELCVEEQSEEQVQLQHQRVQLQQRKQQQKAAARAAAAAAAAADAANPSASSDSSDSEDDDDSPEPALPQPMYIYRFIPQSPAMYRLYSHPFTVVLPIACTVAQLFTAITHRLAHPQPHKLRLGWLSAIGWMEAKPDGDDAQRPVSDCMHTYNLGGIGVFDPDHAKGEKAGAVHGLTGLAGRTHSLWRSNNSAVKIYQQ